MVWTLTLLLHDFKITCSPHGSSVNAESIPTVEEKLESSSLLYSYTTLVNQVYSLRSMRQYLDADDLTYPQPPGINQIFFLHLVVTDLPDSNKKIRVTQKAAKT